MPADPECPRCQGTGWREVERNGLSAVERCGCARAAPPNELLAAVGIPERFHNASFENFRCGRRSENPIRFDHLTKVFTQVKAFVRDYPFGERRGLLLHGPTGVGKTHLAVAALKSLIERGFSGVFFDYQTLLQKIRDGYNAAAGASDREAYRAALEAEILLLDDLGAHRASDWVFDTVTAIITHRYNENKTLLATANLPLGERSGVRQKDPASGQYRLRDTLAERIGERAVSRLAEMCYEVRISAEDYRRAPARRP